MQSELLPYQSIGVFRMLYPSKGRALLGDEPGLGKSIQALFAALPLRRKRPIIITCPASAKWSWEDEVKKHTNLQSWVLEGRTPPRYKHFLHIPPVIILNYDILHYWIDFLKKLKPNVVIPDEFHFCKDHRVRKANKRTKALRQLCKGVPYIFALSGTAIENRPRELFAILNILRPDLYPSFFPFGERYCGRKVTPFGVTYDGASNTKELHTNLKKQKILIRRTQKQVLKDLPPLNKVIVPLDIDYKEYLKAEQNIIAWLITRGKSIHGVVNSPGLTRFGHLLRYTSELKIGSIIKWIDDFLENKNEKLVVFGFHKKVLSKLYNHYKNISVLVDGSVTGRKRKAAIDEFAQSKIKRLFIGNIIAAGIAINKLVVASKVAIVELIWNPAKIAQAIKRLHRIGQKRPVTAYFLTARNTVEDTLCRTLIEKQDVLDQVLDGKDSNGEFEVFKAFRRKLRQRRVQNTGNYNQRKANQ